MPLMSATGAIARDEFERERAAAYQDLYRKLDTLGELRVARAISFKPYPKALSEPGVAKPISSESFLPSPFEQVLFRLYQRILLAFKKSLVDSHLPTSIVIRRLAQCAESTYHEIYVTRPEEFAQRAGFCAEKAFPEPFLGLLKHNARGHTSLLFRQLDDEVLAKAAQSMAADDPTGAVEPSPNGDEPEGESERKVAPADPGALDLEERKVAYATYKRNCKKAGIKMTEKKLAQLANRGWNTRDPVMKWKEGKDRPGDDRLIRLAMQKVPSPDQP